jgi:hypothetical protein
MPKELDTIDDIEEILSSRAFERLIGLAENEILEAKDQAWDLDSLSGKQQFAKDVSAFANFRGGVILVGPHTEKPTPLL